MFERLYIIIARALLTADFRNMKIWLLKVNYHRKIYNIKNTTKKE